MILSVLRRENDFIIRYQIEGIKRYTSNVEEKKARCEGTSAKNVKTLRMLARERA